MATTTVTTWSENPGDVTAEGLVIAGITISYAELTLIEDRETAIQGHDSDATCTKCRKAAKLD